MAGHCGQPMPEADHSHIWLFTVDKLLYTCSPDGETVRHISGQLRSTQWSFGTLVGTLRLWCATIDLAPASPDAGLFTKRQMLWPQRNSMEAKATERTPCLAKSARHGALLQIRATAQISSAARGLPGATDGRPRPWSECHLCR
jgi:hypothetical protein